MPSPKDDRTEPPLIADERTLLDGFLDYHRQTLLWKCAELTDDQMRERSVPPSQLSLHGLVRHLADVERSWFRQRFAGEDLPDLFYTEDNPDEDFLDTADADVAADLAAFQAEVLAARDTVKDRGLDETFTSPRGRTYSLRWLYLHMIEEYARHNGHADLLRERIDGATGE
ncbi:MAG TPA: DinB family protein [Mycobacteriales bacterium]|nr:DinB family protein [Mycobacteriales bacterium]